MRRPRHRVKSNLLWKMLGLAALANVLLWPILIRIGAFHGVRQELFPVTLVTRPPAPKAPKPAPVIAKAPSAPAALPAPKPKPVLVAAARPAAVSVRIAAKPTAPTSFVIHDNHLRRKLRPARRPTEKNSTAKGTAPHSVLKRPTTEIAAVRVPAKPTPKPAERVAVKQTVAKSKPTQIADSNPPTAPSTTPDTNTVSPAETQPPVLKPAVALVKVQPAIPESMLNSAWQALFRGQFLVDKDGNVTPQMISSTGHSILDARALEAAKHWKFQPATRDGVPVASTVKFEIEYAVRSVP
jgi:protein TonB